MQENVINMPASKSNTFGIVGLVLGILGLGLVLLHFYAGPIDPPPVIGKVMVEKNIKVMGVDFGRVKIGEPQAIAQKKLVNDRVATLVTMGVGFLSIVFAVIGYVRREDKRISGSAVALGGATLAIQILIVAICTIVVALVISALLSNFVELS